MSKDTKEATEEYVVEKLHGYILKAVDKHYKFTDIPDSLNKILWDYSGVLHTLKTKDDAFDDFHIIGNIAGDNIILSTRIELQVASQPVKYYFSCVIEALHRKTDKYNNH